MTPERDVMIDGEAYTVSFPESLVSFTVAGTKIWSERKAERAAVVAWLRDQADQEASFWDSVKCWLLGVISPTALARAALRAEADSIEAGDHLKHAGAQTWGKLA